MRRDSQISWKTTQEPVEPQSHNRPLGNASYVTSLPATIVSTAVMLFHWNKKTLHSSSHSHRVTGVIAEWQPHHLMISTTSQELKSWKNIEKYSYNTTCRKPRRFSFQLKASGLLVSLTEWRQNKPLQKSTPASPSTRVRKPSLFCSRQKHFKIQFQVKELFESYPGE